MVSGENKTNYLNPHILWFVGAEKHTLKMKIFNLKGSMLNPEIFHKI